ncbi:hypothetical protein HDV05_001053 [Chytridiales sp. JEL 0842]|nr:hypothetical protein HDV05_001053 [Chytridiales sp. JEL 0842]
MVSTVADFYGNLNPATLSGAIDIVVVEQETGELKCSPFHVRFGKLKLLRPYEKKVEITVNGNPTDLMMKVGEAGEAFFVVKTDNPVPSEYATSPITEGSALPEGVNMEPFDLGAPLDVPLEANHETRIQIQPSTDATQEPPSSDVVRKTVKNAASVPSFKQATHTIGGPSADLNQTMLMEDDEGYPQSEPELEALNSLRRGGPLSDSGSMGPGSPGNEWSWTWGGLPTKAHEDPKKDAAAAPAARVGTVQMDSVVVAATAAVDETQSVESTDLVSKEATLVGSSMSPGPLVSATTPAAPPVSSLSAAIKRTTSGKELQGLNVGASGPDSSSSQDGVSETVVSMSTDEKVGHFLSTLPATEVEAGTEASSDQQQQQQQQQQVPQLAAKPTPISAPTPVTADLPSSSSSSSAPIAIPSLRSDVSVRGSSVMTQSAIPSTGSPLARYEPLTNPLTTTTLVESPPHTPTTTQQPHDILLPPLDEIPTNDTTAPTLSKIEISLCGRHPSQDSLATAFDQHLVTLDSFLRSPQILNDPMLVLRVDGGVYYDGSCAGGLLVALALNGWRPLSEESVRRILEVAGGVGQNGAAALTTTTAASGGVTGLGGKPAATTATAVEARRYSSFQNLRSWWSRSSAQAGVGGGVEGSSPPATPSGELTAEVSWADGGGGAASGRSSPAHEMLSSSSPKATTDGVLPTASAGVDANLRPSTPQTILSSSLNSETLHPGATSAAASGNSPPNQPTRNTYVKSLRLTSDQLKALNLQKGVNTVTFSVTSRLQGTATCQSKIFFWDHDTQIVISDVDGTITKSDVLGHVLTMVGRDWTHSGVASLYTNIHKNGYQILYLTSRAIGQAEYTRDYLKKIEQGTYQLPDGPVIMSPDRLFTAFHREVIQRRPEEFKIACLKDIQRLFPTSSQPFYAGFGNRITDALSYRTVQIPPSRIFTIDPTGEVKLELVSSYKSTYVKLNDVVDQIFPPVGTGLLGDGGFADFGFWREGVRELEVSLEELESGVEGGGKKKKKEEEEGGEEAQEEEEEEEEEEEDYSTGDEEYLEGEEGEDEEGISGEEYEEDEQDGEEEEMDEEKRLEELAKRVKEAREKPF